MRVYCKTCLGNCESPVPNCPYHEYKSMNDVTDLIGEKQKIIEAIKEAIVIIENAIQQDILRSEFQKIIDEKNEFEEENNWYEGRTGTRELVSNKELVKQANQEIEQDRIRKRKAMDEAKRYFGG